jgi:molecular chaperone HscB
MASHATGSLAERPSGPLAAAHPSSCWHCNAETAPDLFCSACDAIKPLPPQVDYFDVLGVPRRLELDAEALRARYYQLSRRLHPDLYQTGPERARAASLVNTAVVNRAYRTLRDPVERGLYWLSLHGESIGSNNKQVPPELAARVFDVQERLQELRAARGTPAEIGLRRDLEAEQGVLLSRRGALLQRLHDTFVASDVGVRPAEVLLRELKQILSEIAYVRTLLRDVGRGLEP